ncbi:MAG: hypothetical protein K5682_11885 [Lachnospiraceae bacterium]|nr:hypothetical protein [Lachnospiraceae bacterium]
MADAGNQRPGLKSEHLAEENRSSAFSLLFVGIIGLILDVLFFLGVIPIKMSTFSRYMDSIVMGILFLVFLIMGIVSLKGSRYYSHRARKEKEMMDSMEQWLDLSLEGENLDDCLEMSGSETPEEMFFLRQEALKTRILQQFPKVEPEFLDHFTEYYYTKLYPDEE